MMPFLAAIAPALILSALVSAVLIITRRYHARFSLDDQPGVQKHHDTPAPRIGGVAVFLALAIAAWLIPAKSASSITFDIILCGLPAFFAGLVEDITKQVSVKQRLLAHLFGALLFVFAAGYVLHQTGFKLTDPLMGYAVIAVPMTLFILVGFTNAINLIDGYNGLAGGTSAVLAAGLAILSLIVGDGDMFLVFSLVSSAALGFVLFNLPKGAIFLGDSGAYFLGFAIGAGGLALLSRNPELSPWMVLLIVIYPVWEVGFSIMRRLRRDGHSPGQPDRVHMHHLMSRSVARPLRNRWAPFLSQNSATGIVMLAFPILTSSIAMVLEPSSLSALIGIFVFQGFYERLYRASSIRKTVLPKS